MNGISTQVKLISVKEGAAYFNIDVKSYRKLLKTYANFLKEHIHKISSKGRTGFTTKITKEGLVVLANMKDRNRKKSNDALDASLQGKKKIVERAIQVSTQPQIQPKSEIQVLLQVVQAMADNERKQNERFSSLEQKLEKATVALTSPVETTAGEREALNKRVARYVNQMKEVYGHETYYHKVWGQIHDHVGVHGVANFKFKHYIAAQDYLKKMYEDSGLVW